nr:ribonuclease H-like domain-containing protein [Tanacetum cinerariifolium]
MKPSLEYFKVFGSKCFILNTKDHLTKFDPKSYEGVSVGYSQNSKAYVVLNKHTIKVEESLNVTFDERPPLTKLSPLVDDDVGEEDAIRKNTKIGNTNNEEDESIEYEEIINIKESKNHPLDQFIRNLNERTLRSQAQNHRFIHFQKPNYVYKLKNELYGLKKAPKAWLEDSKPTKMLMSTKIKLTKDDEADSIDSSKYRVDLDLSRLAITLKQVTKIHSKGYRSDIRAFPPTPQAPYTLSTIKLPNLNKGEYDIWAMKMEHYLEHTYYPIWEVIQKGNGLVQVLTDTNGQIRVLPPKTAKKILARERERKERTTLLMAIPEDHLTKFHKLTNAKEMWDAIKSRFGGNDESKKMQRYIMKQQFESFFVSNSEGLHKGYDWFQILLSQLKTHGVGVSTEDANQKFLSGPQLDHEDLKQVNEFDLEKMDLKWQVAMISTRLKKFYKKIRRKLHLMPRNILALTREKLSAPIATIQDTLLESADQKGIKTVEGEMQETLDTRQATMERDMQNRINIKLWSLLMEKALIVLYVRNLMLSLRNYMMNKGNNLVIDIEEPLNEGKLSEETKELKLTTDTKEIAQDKGSGEKGGSTEELVSTARPEDSTVRPDVGTADPIAPLITTTTSIFDDEDITMAQTLIKMEEEKAKEKGMSIKDKGKEEPEPAKKMTKSDLDAAQIAKDAKVARLVYEEELAELEREKEKRQREEEKSRPAIAEMLMKFKWGLKLMHCLQPSSNRKKEKSLYERQKKVLDDFKPMDSDDAVDKEKILEEPDNTKVEVKQEVDEESIRKRPDRRLKVKATKKSKRQKTDSDLKEEEHLKTFLQIVLDEEGKVDYEVLDKRFPIIN